MQEDRKMRRSASVSPRVNDGCQSKPVPVKRRRRKERLKMKRLHRFQVDFCLQNVNDL